MELKFNIIWLVIFLITPSICQQNYDIPLQGEIIEPDIIFDEEIQPENNTLVKIPGLVIKITDGYYHQLQALLTNQNLNIEVKAYEFEGGEWYYSLAINYGHLIIMYIMMSRFQNNDPQQPNANRFKFMFIGMAVVIGWMFLSQSLKIQRIAIEHQTAVLYVSNQFKTDEIIEKINYFIELSSESVDY